MKKLLLSLLLVGSVFAQREAISFIAANPTAVVGLNVFQTGVSGTTTFYYIVVANYPAGSVLSQPVQITNANSTLNGSNFNTIIWTQQPSATSYDVLRGTVPSFSLPCTCAVATGVTGNSQTDQSNTLSGYSTTLATTAAAQVRLNNRDFATPRLEWYVGNSLSSSGTFGPLPNTSGGIAAFTALAVPFAASTGVLTQDPTNFAYTASGPIGPYLSIGTTAQTNARLLVFKNTASTHASETTILGDYNAPFDGTNAGFGVQGLAFNSGNNSPLNCPGGSCNPFNGHVIGVEGNFQETGTGLLTGVGVEGRADVSTVTSAQEHYSGVLAISAKNFSGSNTNTQKAIETVLQSCNSSAVTFATGGPNNDLPGGHLVCTSPDAHGTGIGIHITQIQGFLKAVGIWGDGDPWFNNGSSVTFTQAANVTTANVNAGFNLVPGVSGHTLTVVGFYLAARGGATATCTDVRLGDSGNANAIVIDPVANLTQNTGNTEGTSTIAQSGFGVTAFGAGLGINIFKSGSACATVTSFDTIVRYTIN